ncbi:YigZ family protein [Nesterenkonia sp. Hz 6-5]|nr:YigZ family protein [Nesterenkonia haasae]
MRRTRSPGEAQDLVDRLRKENSGARHCCSAWVIGHDRQHQRGNDDGEPSGTAGAPMLEALMKAETPGGSQDFSDVCVVVIRWFGGTLLGAGGLVSAYSDSVVTALEQARELDAFRARQRMRTFQLVAPIGEAGRWEHRLRHSSITVNNVDYTSQTGVAIMDAAIPDDHAALHRLSSLVATLSGGDAELNPTSYEWRDIRSDT